MSGLKSNKNFELPVGSNSVLDIQEYFEHIIKKHESVADNLPIRMHGNNIENTITFKMKTGYYLDLLSPDIMKIVGSTKSKMIKDENCESVSHLKITEVGLVQCNIVNNDYHPDFRVMYTSVPNILFGQLLDISFKNIVFLKIFSS